MSAETYRAAEKLLRPEGSWCQGNYAQDKHGHAVDVFGDDAVRFCAIGAIKRANGGNAWAECREFGYFIHRQYGFQYFEASNWNDAEERTQDEVRAALLACADEIEGASK